MWSCADRDDSTLDVNVMNVQDDVPESMGEDKNVEDEASVEQKPMIEETGTEVHDTIPVGATDENDAAPITERKQFVMEAIEKFSEKSATVSTLATLSTLDDLVPATIICGKDGGILVLQGMLTLELLSHIGSWTRLGATMPLFKGGQIKVRFMNASLKVGKVRVDMMRKAEWRNTFVYFESSSMTSQGKRSLDAIVIKSHKGSIPKLTRKVELAKFLANR